MPNKFPFFQWPFLFGRIIHHPFFWWAHTCQGNSFIEPLFALAHFLVLQCSTRVFPSFVFICLVVIPLAFEHFVSQLAYVGLLVQPHACTSWSPSSLPFNFPPLVDFCCPSDGITVLGIMFGSTSFISYFL
jgi:hypothetical protein